MAILPSAWSRERRSTVTIAIAVFGLIVFLWVLAQLLGMMPEPIGSAADQFASGAKVTVELTVLSGVVGLAVGLLAAFAKLSKLPPLRWLANFYIWVVRGTPLLVQIYFVFFALSEVLQGLVDVFVFLIQRKPWLAHLYFDFFALPDVSSVELSDFNSAVIALALNVGAYNAEAIRAGILAVHKGQVEAARSLGLSPLQTFRDIVFPQSFRIALPSLVNNFVSLLKDSSLASVIGVVELMNISNRVRSATYQSVPVLVASAIIYLILTSFMTQVSGAIERQLDIENHK